MDQLRKLTCKYQEIFILEEYCFLAFKRHFIYIAQKYLKSSATTENKELVELFVRNLDTIFQDILSLKLSLLSEVKIDKFGRSKVKKNPYNFEYVIQKAIELISKKTIA